MYINKSIATTGVSFLRGSSRSKVLPVFAALQLFGTPNPPGPLATAAAPGSPSDADAAARLHRRSWAPKWASHCSWWTGRCGHIYYIYLHLMHYRCCSSIIILCNITLTGCNTIWTPQSKDAEKGLLTNQAVFGVIWSLHWEVREWNQRGQSFIITNAIPHRVLTLPPWRCQPQNQYITGHIWSLCFTNAVGVQAPPVNQEHTSTDFKAHQ